MVRMIIEGDLEKKHITEICKLLVKRFKGKEEHINVFVDKDENLSIEEIKEMIKEIW